MADMLLVRISCHTFKHTHVPKDLIYSACWFYMVLILPPKAGGEGDYRGWDGWMASSTQWTWVWASSRSWWRTGRPHVLQSMGSQRMGHDWVTELNWTELNTPTTAKFKVPKWNHSVQLTKDEITKLSLTRWYQTPSVLGLSPFQPWRTLLTLSMPHVPHMWNEVNMKIIASKGCCENAMIFHIQNLGKQDEHHNLSVRDT